VFNKFWLAAALACCLQSVTVLLFFLVPPVPDSLLFAWGGSACLAVLALFFYAYKVHPSHQILSTGLNALEDDPLARQIHWPDGQVFQNWLARSIWGQEYPLNWVSQHLALPDEFETQEAIQRLHYAYAQRGYAQETLALTGEDRSWVRFTIRGISGTLAIQYTMQDITAERALMDSLKRDFAYLSDAVYLAPVGILAIDINGRILQANQRLCGLLGCGEADLVAEQVADIVQKGWPYSIDGAWSGAVQFMPPHKSADNTSQAGFIGHVFASVADNAGQNVIWAVVIPQDDTQGVNPLQETALAVPHQKDFAYDNAPLGLATLDLEGCVLDANHMLATLANSTAAAMRDKPLSGLLITADRDAFDAGISKLLLHGGDSFEIDAHFLGRPEASIHVQILPWQQDNGAASGVPSVISQARSVEGFVISAIDRTEQKNLELQFAQAQKMQAMGQLAGGVAHDFNNLLTAMLGCCDFLLQKHGPGDSSFTDLMQIHQNANRAANLVRQLLAFSRRQPLQAKNLNVTEALNEVSHLLRRLMGENVDLQFRHGKGLGVIRVDPGQFDQMIINLAVNARDAMPGGGTLLITTSLESFSHETSLLGEQLAAGAYVCIQVKDTGTGMEPDVLARVFEPFFSTKTGPVGGPVGAGTGLGLSTVYGLVKQVDGAVTVSSTPGAGTEFSLYLPSYTDEQKMQVQPPVLDVAPLGVHEMSEKAVGRKILLVEDEDTVRAFAARVLKNKGYDVLEARTGEGALDLLQEQAAIDLLITDMVMPGMDGVTLAGLVRAEWPDTPVILMSGYSEDVSARDFLAQDHVIFMGKPFTLKALTKTVADILLGAT
jgi:two-component system cell cycle sensor histidine kinase/response regulator CckA